ncbi:hypothetical protein GQ53DRAFT_820795 [Thozetella sp. PMI_491]|nr:hypothetical protein GQ53DRAFT_820795 [Thozetella sp. PMI_491]
MAASKTFIRAQLYRIFLDQPADLENDQCDANAPLSFPEDLDVVALEAAAFTMAFYWKPNEVEIKTPTQGYMIACVPARRFEPGSPTGGVCPGIYRQQETGWWDEKTPKFPCQPNMVVRSASASWSETGALPGRTAASPMVESKAGFEAPEYDALLLTDQGKNGEQYRYTNPLTMPPLATSKSIQLGREFYRSGEAVLVNENQTLHDTPKPPPGLAHRVVGNDNRPFPMHRLSQVAKLSLDNEVKKPLEQSGLGENDDPTKVAFIKIPNPKELPTMKNLIAAHAGRAGRFIMRLDPKTAQLYACIPKAPYVELPQTCDHCAQPPRHLLKCNSLCRFHAYYTATGACLSIHESRVLHRMDRRGLVLSISGMVAFVEKFRVELSKLKREITGIAATDLSLGTRPAPFGSIGDERAIARARCAPLDGYRPELGAHLREAWANAVSFKPIPATGMEQ